MRSILLPSSTSSSSSSSSHTRSSSSISSLLNRIPFYLLNILLLLSTIPNLHSTQAFLLDQCAMAMSALTLNPHVNNCIPSKTWEALILADDVTPKLMNDTAADICPRPLCDPTTVDLIENTIDQNCINATDKEEKAGTNWLYGVSSLYIPLKEGMCQTVSPTNGTFCITTLTQNLIAYSNSKTPGKKFTWEMMMNGTQMQRWIDSVPSSLVCTPCTQSMVNPLDRYVSVHQLSLDPYVVAWVRFLQVQVTRKCGEGFINALPPPVVPPVDSRGASFLFPSSFCQSWGFVVIAVFSLLPSLLLSS